MITEAGGVSVIIPTRNRKEELVRAIESVRTQSLPAKEIIVVDDMSDFSVKKLLSGHPGDEIAVIRNSTRLGASESRNIGARQSCGEFLAFLDSDDYWEPTKLENQMSVFRRRPELGLVYCDQWRVDGRGQKNQSGKMLVDTDIFGHLIQGWTAPNTSTLVFRRKVFLELGGFDSKLSSCQDHDVWMRVGQQQVPVGFHPERLAYFSSSSPIRISRDYVRRLEGMERFLEKWKGAIEDSFGKAAFKRFKSEYVTKVAYPLASMCLREGQIPRAARITMKYLITRKGFYGRLSGIWRRRVVNGVYER